jgi:hypothetical protein
MEGDHRHRPGRSTGRCIRLTRVRRVGTSGAETRDGRESSQPVRAAYFNTELARERDTRPGKIVWGQRSLGMAKTTAAVSLPILLLSMALTACGTEEEGTLEMADFNPAVGLPEDAPTGRALVRTPEGEREVSYAVVGGRAIMEGDIDLGPVEKLRTLRDLSSLSNPNLLGARWPSSMIHYLKPNFNVTAIQAAIADLNTRTDLQFIELPVYMPGINMIVFEPSLDPGVSSSAVGMQGGVQVIKIWPSHGRSVVEHELMHAVGIWHEQQRLDRDDFININWFCMPQSRWHNFDQAGHPWGAYDFQSIMHYGSFAFSSIEGCPVMTRKDGSTFSASSSLSTGDIAGINLMY